MPGNFTCLYTFVHTGEFPYVIFIPLQLISFSEKFPLILYVIISSGGFDGLSKYVLLEKQLIYTMYKIRLQVRKIINKKLKTGRKTLSSMN